MYLVLQRDETEDTSGWWVGEGRTTTRVSSLASAPTVEKSEKKRPPNMQTVRGDSGGDDRVELVMGGDPACWLHQVCDACGAIVDPEDEHHCDTRLGMPAGAETSGGTTSDSRSQP